MVTVIVRLCCIAVLALATTAATAAGQPEPRKSKPPQPEPQTTATANTPTEAAIDFNIPAQALATALEAFSLVSGYQILMSGAGAQGARSKTLEGALSPRVALKQMIDGTGLEVRF